MSGMARKLSSATAASSAAWGSPIRMIRPPRAATSCMLETVFSNTRVARREHDDRHRLVDQRDRPMLQFARRIAFGVDVGEFLQLQRALERERIGGAAAEIEHVAGARELVRDLLDLRLQLQRLGEQARRRDQLADQRALLRLARTRRARARGSIARQAIAASWQVKALVEATPISGPASVGAAASASRAMLEVGTLTTASVLAPRSLA